MKTTTKSTKTLLAAMAALFISQGAWAASFTALSSHDGSLNAGGISWQCAGGTCKGAGDSGSEDADMKACQALVKATGPLGSFKSSNGTEWSPTKNPNRMAFCNSAVAYK